MIRVDLEHIRRQLCQLADIGKTSKGVSHLAYSEDFFRANKYVADLMRQAGMTVRTSRVGNVIGTYPGKTKRRIVIGSHIDSVVDGGMFDGCLGVIAGIEAVRTLRENGITPEHTLDIASFAEEEGLVIAGLVGSRAYCGLPPTPIMRERMGKYGFTEQDFEEAAAEEGPLDYSLELHIEQGGVLENRGMDIGVVSAIIAIKRYIVEFSGVANHAGTTPMNLRDDALVKAARFIRCVQKTVIETDPEMVGTVGRMEVFPNAMNTIPGKVSLTLELRALREESITAVHQRLMREFENEIASCHMTMEQPSYHMDSEVREAIYQACGKLGLSAMDMSSGAGHDSMSLAQVTKAGMLFVPSVKGVSHSWEEKTHWRDVANGADALLQTFCILDKNLTAK